MSFGLGAFVVITIVLAIVFHFFMEGPSADDKRLARRCVAAKRHDDDDARDGELVKVEGCIELEEDGGAPLITPVSAASSVYFRLTVERESGDSFDTVSTLDETITFGVRTDAGLFVRVSGAGFEQLRRALRFADSGPVVDANEASKRFLASKGYASDKQDGFVRRHRYQEHHLPVGTRVLVLGKRYRASISEARMEAESYRHNARVDDRASSPLRDMVVVPELVTTATEAQVTAAARVPLPEGLGWIAICLGAGAACAGVLVGIGSSVLEAFR